MSSRDKEDLDFHNDLNDYSEQEKVLDIDMNKKNIPVKAHIKKLEDEISKLRAEQNESMKCSSILRGELNALDCKVKEKCNELTKCIMDDLSNFEKDLKRVIQNDKTETDFFKMQTNSLNEDKIKLQREVISLQSRMKLCETDIGVV